MNNALRIYSDKAGNQFSLGLGQLVYDYLKSLRIKGHYVISYLHIEVVLHV